MITLNDLLPGWHGLGCIQSFRHTHSHLGAHHRFYCPFQVQKIKTTVEFVTMRIFMMRQYHRQQQEPAKETNSLTRTSKGDDVGFLLFAQQDFRMEISQHIMKRIFPRKVKPPCIMNPGQAQSNFELSISFSPLAPNSPQARPDFSVSAQLTAGEARFLR